MSHFFVLKTLAESISIQTIDGRLLFINAQKQLFFKIIMTQPKNPNPHHAFLQKSWQLFHRLEMLKLRGQRRKCQLQLGHSNALKHKAKLLFAKAFLSNLCSKKGADLPLDLFVKRLQMFSILRLSQCWKITQICLILLAKVYV